MVDQAGGDIDDVSRPLTDHLSHCRLRYTKEPAEVDTDSVHEIVLRVVCKRLTDEYPGVVYQGVHSCQTA